MRGTPLQKSIHDLELVLTKQKAVYNAYPDSTVHYGIFSSKSINTDYTNFLFEKTWNGLYVIPYVEIEYSFDNKIDFIKVFSIPRANKLVHLTYYRNASGKRIMKFAKFAINQKKHNFKEEMLNACKAEIMNFIKEHPTYHIDSTHLEPRLKKMLMFT